MLLNDRISNCEKLSHDQKNKLSKVSSLITRDIKAKL